jgi:hypothetical protein
LDALEYGGTFYTKDTFRYYAIPFVLFSLPQIAEIYLPFVNALSVLLKNFVAKAFNMEEDTVLPEMSKDLRKFTKYRK